MTTRTIAALSAIAVACAISIPAQSAPVNPNPIGVDPEHYQCYSVTPPTAFVPRTVRLVDQFGVASVKVVNVRFICAPVSKNGELVADTKSHLVCYTETGGKTASKRVETLNQFGTLQFTVQTAGLLCVPSLKRVLPN